VIVNGVDLDGLAAQALAHTDQIPVVPGRRVHIDADFLAYQCSYEHPDEKKSLDTMCHNVQMAMDTLLAMSGAESAVLHLTPKESDKGGRFDIALLKEYQGNRKDKPKPRYLHLVRDYMHQKLGAIMHYHCEADDGMSMAQYRAIADGMVNRSVIATKDKDLDMVPGWHLVWDTGELKTVKPMASSASGTIGRYGEIWIDESKKVKKLKGLGHKFFWAQMLMGDSADNISGIPLITGRVAKAMFGGKDTKCGPITAHKILDGIPDSKTAFTVIRSLYQDYGETHGFINWRDGSSVTWQTAMISEMKLLWMRRNDDPDDVIQWLKEINEC
jgi:hypothetical protein